MKRVVRVLVCRILPISFLLIPTTERAAAVTFRVPDDFGTIQAALDVASVGDTVLVSAGLYTGAGNRDLHFAGKDLVLRSVAGADATVIDCQGTPGAPHRGFFLHGGETNAAVIDGFTIRNALAVASDGGGIHLDGSSPTIRSCVIESSATSGVPYDGGGLFMRASNARIEDCTIRWNWATYGAGIAIRGESSPVVTGCTVVENIGGYGGGIDTGNTSSPWIRDCWIAGNDATNGFEDPGSGGGLVVGGEAIVENCLITGNLSGFGAGVASWGGTPRLIGCTVASNDAGTERGGGVSAQLGSLDLERTIVWGNCAALGEQFYAGPGGTISIRCSVYDSSGTVEAGGLVVDLGDNLLEDPLLCDPASCTEAPTVGGEYTIHRDSPCMPVNHPCGDWIGARGVGCSAADVGESEAGHRGQLVGSLRPNPAFDRLDFSLALPSATHLRVEVLDVSGRRLARLIDGKVEAGVRAMRFDPPRSIPGGVYFLRVTTDDRTEAKRFVVVR